MADSPLSPFSLNSEPLGQLLNLLLQNEGVALQNLLLLQLHTRDEGFPVLGGEGGTVAGGRELLEGSLGALVSLHGFWELPQSRLACVPQYLPSQCIRKHILTPLILRILNFGLHGKHIHRQSTDKIQYDCKPQMYAHCRRSAAHFVFSWPPCNAFQADKAKISEQPAMFLRMVLSATSSGVKG